LGRDRSVIVHQLATYQLVAQHFVAHHGDDDPELDSYDPYDPYDPPYDSYDSYDSYYDTAAPRGEPAFKPRVSHR